MFLEEWSTWLLDIAHKAENVWGCTGNCRYRSSQLSD